MKEQHLGEIKHLFANMEVSVVSAIHFLGRYIGCKSEVHEFIRSKVKGWVDEVNCLAKATCHYPQSAYTTFIHSMSSECIYLQFVVSGCDDEYISLHDTIEKVFIPALLGRRVLQQEHGPFSLFTKKGGLALTNPVSTSSTTVHKNRRESQHDGTPYPVQDCHFGQGEGEGARPDT